MVTPAIDTQAWKARFRTPVILWTAIARDRPDRGLVCSNRSGAYQLYAWDVASGKLSALTDVPDGVMRGVIDPDGRFVYYLADEGGNEIGHFVRVPFDRGWPEDITPDLPLYFPAGFAITSNRAGLAINDAAGTHLFILDADPDGSLGAPRQIFTSTAMSDGPLLSRDGNLALMATARRTGRPQFSLVALDAASGEEIAELWDGPESSIEPVMFSSVRGDDRVLAQSNRTGANRPLIWNPRSGERVDLEVSGQEGEVMALDWSPDGRLILLSAMRAAEQHLAVYDLASHTLRPLRHPAGTYGYHGGMGTYFAPDGEIFAQWQDSTHPSSLIALDPGTGEQTRTILAAGAVPASHPWRSISFPSTNGQEIQGWLAAPDGAGPFPTILETHGGPTAVQTEVFSARAQSWLDHGFAFLTINYRGSTTFGREFEQAIWGNLGACEVEDMVAARNWLVSNGIARPDAIFLTGWSYGGYLTLQALGTHPDLWAGGMAGVAVADWVSQFEDESDTLRAYDVALFGGTPENMREAYVKSSPITYAERVQAPVIIIQGRNDTRDPARQVVDYEAKMRALGKPIEVHWFDAGHIVGKVDQAIEHQELFLNFAQRTLRDTQ